MLPSTALMYHCRCWPFGVISIRVRIKVDVPSVEKRPEAGGLVCKCTCRTCREVIQLIARGWVVLICQQKVATNVGNNNNNSNAATDNNELGDLPAMRQFCFFQVKKPTTYTNIFTYLHVLMQNTLCFCLPHHSAVALLRRRLVAAISRLKLCNSLRIAT